MPSIRICMFLAAFAAVAAGSGVRVARAETGKDELAQGDWKGEKKWEHVETGGGGTTTTASATTPSPSPTGGTPTTPTTGSPPPATGSPPPVTGTPTVPTGPATGGSSEPVPGGLPGPVPTPPTTPIPSNPPALPSCDARWVCEVTPAVPDLYERETLLTLTLFRTDSFAFICNGYCRAESTWFVDAFATTEAGHSDLKTYSLCLRLEHPCPYCKPAISLQGISVLDARAKAKTPWGSLNSSTAASANAATSWAGDIDCSDQCSATVVKQEGSAEAGIELGPLKAVVKSTSSYVYVEAPGGKSDKKDIQAARTDLLILDKGSVSTYAAGTDDNAQAKCRAAYFLKVRGESACGARGEYEVKIAE